MFPYPLFSVGEIQKTLIPDVVHDDFRSIKNSANNQNLTIRLFKQKTKCFAKLIRKNEQTINKHSVNNSIVNQKNNSDKKTKSKMDIEIPF
jgi:hypothetical protein